MLKKQLFFLSESSLFSLLTKQEKTELNLDFRVFILFFKKEQNKALKNKRKFSNLFLLAFVFLLNVSALFFLNLIDEGIFGAGLVVVFVGSLFIFYGIPKQERTVYPRSKYQSNMLSLIKKDGEIQKAGITDFFNAWYEKIKSTLDLYQEPEKQERRICSIVSQIEQAEDYLGKISPIPEEIISILEKFPNNGSIVMFLQKHRKKEDLSILSAQESFAEEVREEELVEA